MSLCTQVEEISFYPRKPISTVFTDVDELADIAEIMKILLTEKQKIDLIYLIIQCAIISIVLIFIIFMGLFIKHRLITAFIK